MLLNEDAGRLQGIYRGGSIVLRESLSSTIAFGARQLLLPDDQTKPTSTKQTWSDEVVILASSGGIAHGVRLTRDPNLVGYWKMDEGSGSQLFDHAGGAHDADLFGNVTWPGGVEGRAIAQAAPGDYARVTDDPSLDITQDVTLSAWVRPELVDTQRLIDKESLTGGYSL